MKKNIIPTLTVFFAFTAATIYFNFNASALDSKATQSLDSTVLQLNTFSDYTITISGHTDSIGSDAYNDKLAEKRAIAVKNYLISQKIDSTKIKYEIYGERKPQVPNTSSKNRTLNRRVELTITGQKNNTTESLATSPTPPNTDTIAQSEKPNNIQPLPIKKEIKKKKRRSRLVWTGWKTGFHWYAAGKN